MPVAPQVVGFDDDGAVAAAVRALDDGLVVGVPTDTVYGLAARLDRPDGIAAVFAAKGHPPDLVLTVLVGRWRQVRQVASTWPRQASVLGARFWPGPLTIVVPARPEVGQAIGGAGTTVGLRRPAHRGVRTLCRLAGPLAVTSAQRRGEPPATTAAELADTFFSDRSVALALDGAAGDGQPSTIVDCTASPPVCLREGAIPWPWVEASFR